MIITLAVEKVNDKNQTSLQNKSHGETSDAVDISQLTRTIYSKPSIQQIGKTF